MAAKLLKKQQKVFGSTAGLNQISKYGSLAAGLPVFTTDPDVIQALSNYLDGWFSAVVGSNSPTIEDMNALCFLFARQLAYIMQEGVAEWDNATEYFIGSIVNDGSGNLYTSLIDNNINNVVTDTTKWKLNGINKAVATKTATYQMLSGDKLIKGDATGGAFNVTLPSATFVPGADYEIVKINANANVVNVATLLGQTISGQASPYVLSEQWQFLRVRSDGTNYIIVSAG
jgi:hypothetical protein